MTAVLSFPQIRSLATGMLALVIACCLLMFATPRVQAQSVPVSGGALTQAQVSAIISLLQSFGADGATITRVQTALNGGVVTPPVISGAPTCSLRADPPAVAPGMSTVLTWSSTNATSASWTNDASGKDNIAPPAGTPATNGSASFIPMKTLPVGMTSVPSVTLKVTGPYGSATCVTRISVVSSQQAQFDNNVFTQTPSATPTISGMASGATQLKVALFAKSGSNTKVYESGSIPVVGGVWSIKVTAQIPAGEYMIYVYNSAGEELTNGGWLKVTEQSTPTKATYKGYIDGSLFITTKDIARADALANCKKNIAANPGRSFRCIWGSEEMYSGTITTSTASLSATPASGPAPLSVSFRGTAGGRTAFGGMRIDFGDGSTGVACDPGRSCGTFTLSHTYAVAGKYIARLIMAGEGSVITLAQTNVKVANPISTSTTSVPVSSSAGAFRTDGPMAFMAAAAAVPFTLAVDMLSSIFFWTGFY